MLVSPQKPSSYFSADKCSEKDQELKLRPAKVSKAMGYAILYLSDENFEEIGSWNSLWNVIESEKYISKIFSA